MKEQVYTIRKLNTPRGIRWGVYDENGNEEHDLPFVDKYDAHAFANALAVARALYNPKLLDDILADK